MLAQMAFAKGKFELPLNIFTVIQASV
jgi:hypothetical protein